VISKTPDEEVGKSLEEFFALASKYHHVDDADNTKETESVKSLCQASRRLHRLFSGSYEILYGKESDKAMRGVILRVYEVVLGKLAWIEINKNNIKEKTLIDAFDSIKLRYHSLIFGVPIDRVACVASK
jgi:hypothetical protein